MHVSSSHSAFFIASSVSSIRRKGWFSMRMERNASAKEIDVYSRSTSPTEMSTSSSPSSSCLHISSSPPSSSGIKPRDAEESEVDLDDDDNFNALTVSCNEGSIEEAHLIVESPSRYSSPHGRSKSEGDEVDYNFYNFIIQGTVALSPEGKRQALTTTDMRDINQNRYHRHYHDHYHDHYHYHFHYHHDKIGSWRNIVEW